MRTLKNEDNELKILNFFALPRERGTLIATHTHTHTYAEKPGDMHRQTAETGVEAASLWPSLEAGVGAEAEARGESRVKNMFGYNSSFMFFVACLCHIPCSYEGSSTGYIRCEWKTKN